MRILVGILLIVTAVCANPVLRWQEGAPVVEQQIPVEIVEIPEPIVFVAPVQSLSTIESIQEVEEPEPIAISNEIVVPLVDDLRAVIVPEKELSAKKVAQKENALEKNQKEKENEDKPKLDKEENKIKAIPEVVKPEEEEKKKAPEDEQRKDDQLQVETVQDEKYVKNILPAPENIQAVPDVPQEVEGELSSEVKKLSSAEIDVNVAPESETEDNGLRQDSVPQGLPSTTRQPPPNLLQQFITNPLQSIQTALSGQGGPLPLEDGATPAPSIFQQGLTSVQQGLQGLQSGIQNQLQGIQSSLSSALNLPSSQTQQTDTLTGEVTTVRPPFNPIQSIQSALSNLLPQGAAAQQDGSQPVSQGPLSGILNLFSPTRPPTTYPPQPSLLSSTQFSAVTDNRIQVNDQVNFDSVESTEESGEITVVREADKEKESTEKTIKEIVDKKEVIDVKVPEKEKIEEEKKKTE